MCLKWRVKRLSLPPHTQALMQKTSGPVDPVAQGAPWNATPRPSPRATNSRPLFLHPFPFPSCALGTACGQPGREAKDQPSLMRRPGHGAIKGEALRGQPQKGAHGQGWGQKQQPRPNPGAQPPVQWPSQSPFPDVPSHRRCTVSSSEPHLYLLEPAAP